MEDRIVNTNEFYNSSRLLNDIILLNRLYRFLNVQIIGNSVLGSPIFAIKLGKGNKKVFYSASIHANEWITSLILMKFVEDYCRAYVDNGKLHGYDVRNLFNSVSIFITPMVNPDGVNLVTNSLLATTSAYQNARTIANNYPNIPFPSGWKANIRGVDLNLQFPAGWEQAKEIKCSQGFTSPAPRDFVGYGPLTEPEALAIYDFTLSHNFSLILSYHTQGQEIYWNFQNINPPRGYEIGQQFAKSSGYLLTEVPYNSSFAGYKDWFIQTYNKPGYTIEAGLGENPLPLSQFNEIYNDNIEILILGAVL